MITVNSIADLPPDVQVKVRAHVFRKVVERLYNSPHVSEETLMRMVGFNRETLIQTYQAMCTQAAQQKVQAAMGGYAEQPEYSQNNYYNY